MRLGAYPCQLKDDTKVFAAYKAPPKFSPKGEDFHAQLPSLQGRAGEGHLIISERHRHRYEFNNEYLGDFEKAGMIASGINPEGGLVEIVELKDHPWFIGVQFHPEYKSTVAKPHPLFVGFVNAAVEINSLKARTSKVAH